ncbi:exopolysaccharide biosynthesis polyprenyl glycosylphosphotransferase [bacterium]|nr:exopolysaccharide biosynthesis polyprenyl glycosylphosphotransferase [bacterium]
MNRNRFGWIFALSDFLSTAVAWFIFYVYRKEYLEPAVFGDIPVTFNNRFYLGIIIIPTFWLLFYYLIGSYKRVYRRSRLSDFGNTIAVSFLGSITIFFALVLDDFVKEPKYFRDAFVVLLSVNFICRYLPRFVILTYIKNKIVKRQIGFNTLLIGDNQKALDLYNELESESYSQGYFFRGFIRLENGESYLGEHLPNLGGMDDIPRTIKEKYIEDVIIALEPETKQHIELLIEQLDGEPVVVKMIPDMYDIVSGRVKMRNVFGAALIEIFPEILPALQANIKRLLDISVSLFLLIALLPFYAFLALWVKTSSKGPVFFKQERIGYKGHPFHIIKFRTMVVDAEVAGPQLSKTNDPRITRAGRILRKYRFDELPQFYNVLIGEMSLVGPRPERQFFIDQIVKKAPQYKHLLKVKPGITSWGMVKYGYAENVEQMIARMKYDLLYIENMSLSMDFKIFAYTAITILGGRGK